MEAPVAALSLAASGEWSAWEWVTRICVTVSPPQRMQQGGEVRGVVGSRIDDGHLTVADDEAGSAAEGERPRIGRENPAHQGRQHRRLTRKRSEIPVEAQVIHVQLRRGKRDPITVAEETISTG